MESLYRVVFIDVLLLTLVLLPDHDKLIITFENENQQDHHHHINYSPKTIFDKMQYLTKTDI